MNYKLLVDSKKQMMDVLLDDVIVKQYLISTAKNGLGEQKDSEQTPRGWFKICEKYGDNAPINSVFVGRKNTGEVYDLNLRHSFPGRDWILTRILRLEGMEEGKNKGGNCDTFERFIYIHGTPNDVELGKPGSKGCIRMNNSDIVELYDIIPIDTQVYIE